MVLQTRIYRGKTSAGDWLYGSLLQCASGCFIALENGFEEFQPIRVIFESIGLCSGRKDIYDNLIFEGDRLKSGHGFEYRVIFKSGHFLAQGKFGFTYGLDAIFKPEILDL